ncbi:hypothetical protein NLI96_g2964 [Meripilus lineatus]|uniref:Nudix hydrolase domain-containing protein n=1 Tax=Meripilus lineatus TaxID=2056292 RepID=A0AAD5YH11_9APHY|nr:hypothetical protein NLI96_g2964 [Physisporinus lineatus]
MASSSSSSPEITAPNPRHRPELQSVNARLLEVLEDLSRYADISTSPFGAHVNATPFSSAVSFSTCPMRNWLPWKEHWYYEDFIREQDPSFPTMTLKKFSNTLFHHCPLLSHWGDDHEQTFQNFLSYKTRVPVCGAIMLNSRWDKCLLVKGWKATSAWSFPKGKINEQEPRHACAVREVLEETGYDLEGQVNPNDVVELSIKEQSISLFIVPNVPEDYPFETRTRKEISRIAWFRLTDLPTWRRNRVVPGKFYLITPFIMHLKAFIRDRKSRGQNAWQPPSLQEEPQAASSDEDGNDNTRSTTSHDANTQESSSQSSSADNGEPQTPSPQYSEPLVNCGANDRIITHETEAQTQMLEMSCGDPHLARLLNGLSISASGMPLTNGNGTDPKAIVTSPDGLTVLTSSTRGPQLNGAQVANATANGVKHSSPSRNPLTTPPSCLVSSRSSSVKPNQSQAFISHSPSPIVPASIVRNSHDPHLTLSPSHDPDAALSHSPVSSRAPTDRRGAAPSADISPYLSRAGVAPMIPKQIKYLAMLENVAKESERVATPTLERQMAPTHLRDHPPPSSSVPPYMMGYPPDPPVLYSSRGGRAPFHAGMPPLPPHANQHNPPLGQQHYDPFTVRPRTSNTFHPIPYPSHLPRVSMNEDQLRLMMCGHTGPRPAPPQNYAGLQRPAPPNLPPPSMRPFPVPPHGGNLQGPLHVIPPHFIPPYQRQDPGPLSAPASSPTFNLIPRTNASKNAQLLSILNTPNVSNVLPPMRPALG